MNIIAEKIQAGAVILDVRTPDEFADGHYPNALNIPVRDLMRRMGEIGDKGKPVVVYCETGARSALAAKLMKASGFKDVINAGGLYDMPES